MKREQDLEGAREVSMPDPSAEGVSASASSSTRVPEEYVILEASELVGKEP